MDKQRKKQIRDWKKRNPGKTQLQKINSSKKSVAEKIQTLIDKGATKIEYPRKSDFDNMCGKGNLVSYITKDGKYRSGGFIVSWNEDYFAVRGGGGYGPIISFSVQYKNIKEAYIRKPSRKNSPLEPIPTDKPKTNYPVKIDKVTVFYGKNNWEVERFKKSNKYNRMVKWSEEHNSNIEKKF